MISLILLFLSSFAIFNAPAGEQMNTGSVVVQVENCQSGRGEIMIALYASKEDFPVSGKELKGAIIRASTTQTETAVFDRLPPGTYAVGVYHDINGNGVMDRRTFGIPTEPYGFSNNPVIKWKAPTFNDAAFQLGANEKKVSITIKKWEEY
jgi:uncharacterized protein (DUF2141 family)